MKKILAIFAAASAFVATEAVAQNDQFYAELNYAHPTGEGYGYSITPSVIAGRFGMKFTDRLAGELLLGTAARGDSTNVDGVSVNVKIKNVVGLYLKGTLPVADKFSVFGRVGYTRAKIQGSALGVTVSDSDSGFSYGVGAQYDFTNQVYGMLDYMSYYDRNGTTIRGPAIGVGMKF